MNTVKLLLYDKFWDAFIELPKGTQKKVKEFSKKFISDSKSAAIHLEPISNFKDSSLKSARIDKTYRAIIKSPDSGNVFFLMWVDHHDKAYQWAENKVFQWNENTQSMQIFTNPGNENTTAVKEQEKDVIDDINGLFGDFSNTELQLIGLPEILLPSVRGIKDLNDLENLEKYLPIDIFENLFYLADGADINSLISEIEEGKVYDEKLEKQVESINNQRNFIELTNDSIFNEVLTGSLDKWKYYLHPSQRRLVNKDFSGSVKVTGGAGTGKTVAAIHRLKYLTNKNSSNDKVLFTTYTKALTSNLIESAKNLDIDISNVEINNLDSLVFDLGSKYKIVPDGIKVFELGAVKSSKEIWKILLNSNLIPYDYNFLEKEYRDVILLNNIKDLQEYLRILRIGRGKPLSRGQRKELWAVFEMFDKLKYQEGYLYKEELYNKLSDYLKEKGINPFSHAIVDELQDFSNVELRLIRSLVAEKSNDLFMVGDPLQKVYNRTINFSRAGIGVRGKKSQRLRINYRTTEEIKRLAVSIIQDCHYDNFDGEEEEKKGYVSILHGIKPVYNIYKTKDHEVDSIVNKINELSIQGYQFSEMVISSRTRNGYRDFKTKLHNAGIPYHEIEKGNKIGDSNGIPLLTFHNIKGLEFKHVYLVDVNDRTSPFEFKDFDELSDEEKEIHLRMEKSLLYVAISRAVQNLEISGVGKKSHIIQL